MRGECVVCKGEGYEVGQNGQVRECPVCRGKGDIDECPSCGAGIGYDGRCPACDGRGSGGDQGGGLKRSGGDAQGQAGRRGGLRQRGPVTGVTENL